MYHPRLEETGSGKSLLDVSGAPISTACSSTPSTSFSDEERKASFRNRFGQDPEPIAEKQACRPFAVLRGRSRLSETQARVATTTEELAVSLPDSPPTLRGSPKLKKASMWSTLFSSSTRLVKSSTHRPTPSAWITAMLPHCGSAISSPSDSNMLARSSTVFSKNEDDVRSTDRESLVFKNQPLHRKVMERETDTVEEDTQTRHPKASFSRQNGSSVAKSPHSIAPSIVEQDAFDQSRSYLGSPFWTPDSPNSEKHDRWTPPHKSTGLLRKEFGIESSQELTWLKHPLRDLLGKSKQSNETEPRHAMGKKPSHDNFQVQDGDGGAFGLQGSSVLLGNRLSQMRAAGDPISLKVTLSLDKDLKDEDLNNVGKLLSQLEQYLSIAPRQGHFLNQHFSTKKIFNEAGSIDRESTGKHDAMRQKLFELEAEIDRTALESAAAAMLLEGCQDEKLSDHNLMVASSPVAASEKDSSSLSSDADELVAQPALF